MITPEQVTLAILKMELASCTRVIEQIKESYNHQNDLAYWEKQRKTLLDRVFELEVLLGVEV